MLLRPLGEQVVLITGATGGLGWEVTGELVSVRATVLLQTWPLSPPRPGRSVNAPAINITCGRGADLARSRCCVAHAGWPKSRI